MDRLDRDARIALIDARDADPLPAAREAAAWARLQAAIAADEAPRSEPAPPARPARAWTVALLLAAAVVLAVAGLDAVVGRPETEGRGQQAVHGETTPPAREADVRRPAPPAAATTTGTSGHVPEDIPEPTAARPPAPARPTRAAADEADIVAELALLRQARAALADGRADEALALLAEHARRFAGGTLVEERARLRVRALCAAGARAEARAEAEAFARARPASPHARKIVRECAEP